MIDIHCHLLPGLDDGPEDLSAAVALARQAVDDGVTHSVITPHIHLGRWDNSRVVIEAAVINFRQALQSRNVPLTLGFAAEVRIGPEIIPMLAAGDIPFLGQWQGRHVLLLEMPHSHIPPGTDKMVTWLIKKNILPMIAHPERNKEVMRNLKKLQPLIDLGCLFQVTAGAVAGQFGDVARERAAQLLKMGVVTVLASDAHHIRRRPVNLKAGVAAASNLIGARQATQLAHENPMRIVGAQFI